MKMLKKVKKIKYLDRWNATLTLLESRIKLCDQMILKNNSDYSTNTNLFGLDHNNIIFNEVGILTNILDKYINYRFWNVKYYYYESIYFICGISIEYKERWTHIQIFYRHSSNSETKFDVNFRNKKIN